MLSIVVLAKFTVDTAQLKVDPATAAPALAAAPWRMSTFDEHALEEAVRLREKHGGTLRLLSLAAARPAADLVLRALAMGADEAHLLIDPSAGQADALATATLLAAALGRLGGWDLVLCGDGSLDQYGRQVGPRVAEALAIPPLTAVTRLELDGRRVTVHRAVEEGTEVVEAELPVLVAVGPEINHPRFPTVLQVMGAARKPIVELRPEDVGATAAELSRVATREVFAPPSARKHVTVAAESSAEIARELARALLAEGVVKSR